MQLTCDLSGLPPAVREKVIRNVQHEDAAQFALAQVEQARMAKFVRESAVTGALKEGCGPMTGIIHQGIKNYLAALHGHKTVYQDPDFMKWLQRNHEEFRGMDVRQKIGVGWTPNLKKAASYG